MDEKFAYQNSIVSGFVKITDKNLFQRGDIVAYKFKTKNATGHVGIMINSSQLLYTSPKDGLRISSINNWNGKPIWVGNRYVGLLQIFLITNYIINLFNEKH